jgi:curved DNA-binding protein CbpA
MEDKTHYEVIGVAPDASHHLIRKAFMKLAEKYQSDRGKFAAAGWYFDRLKVAYDALSDYGDRCRYNAERGLPEPPAPEQRGEVSWLEGLARLIPSNWYVFAFMAVGVIYVTARYFNEYWTRAHSGGVPGP